MNRNLFLKCCLSNSAESARRLTRLNHGAARASERVPIASGRCLTLSPLRFPPAVNDQLPFRTSGGHIAAASALAPTRARPVGCRQRARLARRVHGLPTKRRRQPRAVSQYYQKHVTWQTPSLAKFETLIGFSRKLTGTYKLKAKCTINNNNLMRLLWRKNSFFLQIKKYINKSQTCLSAVKHTDKWL